MSTLQFTNQSDRPRTRWMTIIAEDPSIRSGGTILTAAVEVPEEALAPGPTGYRVQVVDYDSSTNTMYKPRTKALDEDPYVHANAERLVTDPQFHQQNVYAIAMSTLRRFEQALGRRVAWHFPEGSHQLKLVPHAFVDANAFYSRRDEAVFFGYFTGISGQTIYTSLSHDVVAHEVTHALVDGLLPLYMSPSSPDQVAFHEGFADTVALLSVFSAFDGVIALAFERIVDRPTGRQDPRLIVLNKFRPDQLRSSFLMSLAEEIGYELQEYRGKPLRTPALLLPNRDYYRNSEFLEPHQRGELLVAAVLNAFLNVWYARISALNPYRRMVERSLVIEAGRDSADRLLLACIRALDYIPPVDVTFPIFLSGLLTADIEINPSDNYGLRGALLDAFAGYGIKAASESGTLGEGAWAPVLDPSLSYTGLYFDAMKFDSLEVYRFLLQNRKALGLTDTRTYVQSVRPVQRVSEEGFMLQESVANYVQILDLRGSELRRYGLRLPFGMSPNRQIRLYGGGSLVFDSYGRLRFHISNPVISYRQNYKLAYLWSHGALDSGLSLAALHRGRGGMATTEHRRNECW